MFGDTIVAQSSPRGVGAIAIVRLSGPDALGICAKFSSFPKNRKIGSFASHTVTFGRVVNQRGETVDQVMFIVLRAPRTFTGEHVVEITCHNNQVIIDSIVELAIAHGARLAAPGEFTRQAVLNGKIDLTEAEAINEVVSAANGSALRASMDQLSGSLSAFLAEIEQRMVEMLSISEASFEFAEEGIDFSHQLRGMAEALSKLSQKLRLSCDSFVHSREGYRVAIIGPVNAGKSTLFNKLLGFERAIATPIEGTTRDAVDAAIKLDGEIVTLVDTAGLRKTGNAIELKGIERALEEAQKADIILFVTDIGRKLTEHEREVFEKVRAESASATLVEVRNKSDLLKSSQSIPKNFGGLVVSAEKGDGIPELVEEIKRKILRSGEAGSSPFLFNRRQSAVARKICGYVDQVKALCVAKVPELELISCELRSGIVSVGELTGKSLDTRVMDKIFNDFCVGK